MPRWRRTLFNLQGSPLDHGGPVAGCFVRGTIEEQRCLDNECYEAIVCVNGSRLFVRAQGDVAVRLATIARGERVAFYGRIIQEQWTTLRDGSRERVVIEVEELTSYERSER